MSSSLLKSFNFNKDKELVNSVLTDYDAFPDKKLLDKLRKIIIERLVDTEIPEGVNLNEFIDDEIDKCLEGYDLTNNPLPSSFIVNLKDPSYAEEVAKSVENMTGVEGIGNQQDVINTISKFVDVVQIVGIGLFIVFIGVSVFLIMNTIKLTVYSRRREVGIMKFVGATDWFIRWPFVIEGIIIGAVGSLASSVILYFAYNGVFKWIVSSMFIVNLVQPQFVLTTLLACFVGGGIVVGAIGSIFALRKFLVV